MQPAVERDWRPPHLRGPDGVVSSSSDSRRRFPSQPVNNNRTMGKRGAWERGGEARGGGERDGGEEGGSRGIRV